MRHVAAAKRSVRGSSQCSRTIRSCAGANSRSSCAEHGCRLAALTRTPSPVVVTRTAQRSPCSERSCASHSLSSGRLLRPRMVTRAPTATRIVLQQREQCERSQVWNIVSIEVSSQISSVQFSSVQF